MAHAVARDPAPQRGFTIIELLIVVTVGAILAAIAVPSLRDTLYNTRQSAALGLVINDLNQARGEAIKRNARMLVCVRNTAGTDCAASTNWQSGWVVCMDATTTATGLPPSDGQCDTPTATNPNPVIVRPPLDSNLTLGAVDATPAAIGSIRFNPNSSQGTANGAVTMTLGGTWSGANSRVIAVQGTGNISKQ